MVDTKEILISNYQTTEIIEDVFTPKTGNPIDGAEHGSPVDEHIEKTRKQEEVELQKCREILQTMRNATDRQRNISQDVQRGIVLLEESLDVIYSIRSCWRSAELRRREQETQTTHMIMMDPRQV